MARFATRVQVQSFSQGGPAWRQIAQDGVQFNYENYIGLGTVNSVFNLAPANRADLLVKAPMQTGKYTLTVQANAGLPLDPGLTNPPFAPETPITLLTVSVEGSPVSPAEDFIQNEKDFPTFPSFLNDIPGDGRQPPA